MSKTIKVLLNFILISLILFTTVILYSENSTNLKRDLTHFFQAELKKTLDVETSIENFDVNWIGLNPTIKMESILMSDSDNRMLLEIPSSEIHINILDTLRSQELSIGKIVINNTILDLKYDKNKIIVNKKKIKVNSNSEIKQNIPVIILNNSDIRITNLINQQTFFRTYLKY